MYLLSVSHMYILKKKKIVIEKKNSVRHMEENEKSKKQNIHKHLKKSFNIIVATVGVA